GCVFFFSSRRRHTRSKRDWSSDVCSSDLSHEVFEEVHQSIVERAAAFPDGHGVRLHYPFSQKLVCGYCGKHYKRRVNSGKIAWRSEERRVGKESRDGWWRHWWK